MGKVTRKLLKESKFNNTYCKDRGRFYLQYGPEYKIHYHLVGSSVPVAVATTKRYIRLLSLEILDCGIDLIAEFISTYEITPYTYSFRIPKRNIDRQTILTNPELYYDVVKPFSYSSFRLARMLNRSLGCTDNIRLPTCVRTRFDLRYGDNHTRNGLMISTECHIDYKDAKKEYEVAKWLIDKWLAKRKIVRVKNAMSVVGVVPLNHVSAD